MFPSIGWAVCHHQIHLLAAMSRGLGLVALNLGHGEAHPTYGAAVLGFDLDEIFFGWLRRYGPGQPPHDPHTDAEDGNTHCDGDEDVQAYSLSMMRALAMPPPSHMVCRP